MAWNEVRFRARVVQQYARVPRVSAAEPALAQVFFNLILNAAHAIEPGHPERNEIRLSTTVDSSGRVIVEVTDSGCGIPPELLRQLNRAEPSAPADAGLGLLICRRIVSRLGGQLQLESRVGQGTTARVTLPALGAPARLALP
jgi:signal transduction histidine kinase